MSTITDGEKVGVALHTQVLINLDKPVFLRKGGLYDPRVWYGSGRADTKGGWDQHSSFQDYVRVSDFFNFSIGYQVYFKACHCRFELSPSMKANTRDLLTLLDD